MNRQTNLNLGWKFHLGEEPNGGYKGLDDSAWQDVTLPHDWSVTQPFDRKNSSGTGYLPGGLGWYRRHMTLPEGIAGKRVLVTFGGVYQNSRCWCNSNYLGMRPYGYSTFTYDITAYVQPGDNVLCVRAEHMELADSRWFTGNGIYRDVTLTVVNPIHIPVDEIFVHTVSADAARAEVQVDWTVCGAGELRFTVRDAAGRTVAQADAQGSVGQTRLTMTSPALWSPASPALYTLHTALYADGALQDETDTVFGVRTVRFDAETGFFLNEQPMKLKGVCVHHDAGALGAAVPRAVWARRLRVLAQAGCNAVRCSHNPPDPVLLDLCDEMGFLVMDEAFDEWEGCKNKWWQGHNVYPPKNYGYADAFPQWHEADLAAMVRRDRNHPCVILWSIGNEIDYPNDPYAHPRFDSMTGNNDANKPEQERLYDPNRPNAERLATVARALVAIVRKHDATRLVTSALAFPELSNLTGYAQALDVVGYNYKEHLYRDDHARYPAHVLLGSENGTHAEAWRAVADNDFISGQFLWTGIDFLGEARGWPVRVSQAGIITLAGFPKPLYALRQALWLERKVARLATGLTDNPRAEAFLWRYAPGEAVQVSCYTNCEAAELFLNGQSQGRVALAPEDGCRARWTVPYTEGTLRVVCTGAGQTVEDCLRTDGPATALCLCADKSALCADGLDVAQVEVSLLDAQGNAARSHDLPLHFALVGDAEIIGIESGDPQDLTPYTSRKRATYRGEAIVYIRAGTQADTVRLFVRADNGVRAELTLTQG